MVIRNKLVINSIARFLIPVLNQPHVHSAPLIQFVACEAFKAIHLDFCPLSVFGNKQAGIQCVYTAQNKTERAALNRASAAISAGPLTRPEIRVWLLPPLIANGR